MSKSSDIAATTDPSRVKFGFFEKPGLKNSFVIGLSLQCRRTCADLRLNFCIQLLVYVNAHRDESSVYVTAKNGNIKIKDLSRNIFG